MRSIATVLLLAQALYSKGLTILSLGLVLEGIKNREFDLDQGDKSLSLAAYKRKAARV